MDKLQKLRSWGAQHARQGKPEWVVLRFVYRLFSGFYLHGLFCEIQRYREGCLLKKFGPGIFERTIKVCERIQVTPYLLRGTLLGYCRYGKFIDYDYDIDLGLLPRDLGKIEPLKKAMVEAGFILHVDGVLTGPLSKIGGQFILQFKDPRSEVRLDFYIFHQVQGTLAYLEDRRFEFMYQNQLLNGVKPGAEVVGYALVYSNPLLLQDFTQAYFMNQKVLVPARAEQYLTETYGDWQTPRRHFKYRNLNKVLFNGPTGDFEFVPLAKV